MASSLSLQGVGVAGRPAAQHDPGQERAEDHVEAELLGDHQQEQQQHDGPADGRLGGGALALLEDPLQPVAPHQPRREAQHHGQEADRDQRRQGHELVAGPEEQGDGEDGEQLPHRPGGQQVAAEAAAQHVVVAQDGQQRAQGGGGQPQGDRDERPHEPDRGQDPDRGRGQRHGDQPGHDGQPPGPLPEQVEVELVAGQQEQEPEPHVGQQVDGRPVGPAEHLGADQHPADQQHHHLGDARAGQQGHEHGGERGHHRRDQQRLQAPGKIHARPPGSTRGRAWHGGYWSRSRTVELGDFADGRSTSRGRPRPAQVGPPFQPCRLGPARAPVAAAAAGGVQPPAAARPGPDPGRPHAGVAVRVPARRPRGDGPRPGHHPGHRDHRAGLRRRPPAQLRAVRHPRAQPVVRAQRLRRDAARPLGVGRQAAGRPASWWRRGRSGSTRRLGRRAAEAMVRTYREQMARYAGMRLLEVWYSRVDASTIVAMAGGGAGGWWPSAWREAEHHTSLDAMPRLTEPAAGGRRFVEDPPLLTHVADCDERLGRRGAGPLPRDPVGRAAPAARPLPAGGRRPQGGRGRQRRDPLLCRAAARGPPRRPAAAPGQAGRRLGAGAARRRQPLPPPRPPGRQRPAAAPDGQRHLPRLDRRRRRPLLHPPALGHEGRDPPGDARPGRPRPLRPPVRLGAGQGPRPQRRRVRHQRLPGVRRPVRPGRRGPSPRPTPTRPRPTRRPSPRARGSASGDGGRGAGTNQRKGAEG